MPITTASAKEKIVSRMVFQTAAAICGHHQARQGEAQAEIERGGQNVDERRLEGRGDQVAGVEHDLRRGDRRDHGGVLQEGDGIVAERRQGDPPGLRQDDVAHGSPGGHADGERRLALTVVDGGKPGAEHLGQDGAAVQPEKAVILKPM
jgi:hypothetical protein